MFQRLRHRLAMMRYRFVPTVRLIQGIADGGKPGASHILIEALRERLAHQDGSLEGSDFSGASLDGALLAACRLAGARFAGAALRGAYFGYADLSYADFTGADLRDANFREAQLTGADFTGADLRGANFARARLKEAKLSEADLRGANFWGAELDWDTLQAVGKANADRGAATSQAAKQRAGIPARELHLAAED